ncbi:hypothetical protein DFJ74DRAFT_299884 [Hyaloraphidium curvatum]|nr:hypothetical protein DFJ74DRAFT_299884 [Hyaloraphidium curvatum]
MKPDLRSAALQPFPSTGGALEGTAILTFIPLTSTTLLRRRWQLWRMRSAEAGKSQGAATFRRRRPFPQARSGKAQYYSDLYTTDDPKDRRIRDRGLLGACGTPVQACSNGLGWEADAGRPSVIVRLGLPQTATAQRACARALDKSVRWWVDGRAARQSAVGETPPTRASSTRVRWTFQTACGDNFHASRSRDATA